MSDYKPVIGLEIHVELKTKSKMFCQCEADYFGKAPNTNTCPVCLGLPGALPVPNKKAVEWTILIGKALNCKINEVSKFDRKHYFYPDLPKGYQISQYDEPIAVNGNFQFPISNLQVDKTIRIRRVHLEEDTAKLLHVGDETLIDFNRSGVPLVEIVTEPDFENSDDVKRFLEELHVIIRYLGVSDADMEKGSMRLEPNISVTNPQGSKNEAENPEGSMSLPNYKVEVKNINSFRFVKQAIEYEVERQIDILKEGKTPKQETRGFDSGKGITYSQRTKEEAHDYRYFPEPDIPPMTFAKKYLETVIVPELPQMKVRRYIGDFGLRQKDAFVLTREPKTAYYFEAVQEKIKLKNEKLKLKNEKLPLKIKNLSQSVANQIINKKISIDLTVEEFVDRAFELFTPKKTDEKVLAVLIDRLVETNKKAVDDYKKGKENVIMFLVGQVMKEMRGRADAKVVKQRLIKKLI